MKLLLIAALAMASVPSHAQTVLLDTFNEADQSNLFDANNVAPLSAQHSGGVDFVAVPFTPLVDGKVTEVDIALSNFSTQNDRVKVEVIGSTMGLPGRLKRGFLVRDVPAGGQCCVFVAETATGVPVKAGGHYWIEAKATGVFVGGWNLNTIDASGPYAVKDSMGWSMTSGALPAVRVIGTP